MASSGHGLHPLYVRRFSDPTQSPRKSTMKKDIIETLQVDLGYSPADWGTRGLDDYFHWSEEQFEGLSFKEAFTGLKAHKIGLDILGMEGLKPGDEAVKWGIPSGDAFRIINYLKRWINEKLSEA